LSARRHIDGRVLREEVDGLEADFEHLARHHGEVFNAWNLRRKPELATVVRKRQASSVHGVMLAKTYMVDSKLNKDNQIVVDDVVFTIRPIAHASAAARLVRVLSATVQLVFAVLDGVDVVVGELGSLVVEAVVVGQNLLERRCMDLVSHWLAIDRVSYRRVLDLEGTVGVRVEIVAAGLLNQSLFGEVAGAVGIEVGAWHGVGFVVDEAVVVAV